MKTAEALWAWAGEASRKRQAIGTKATQIAHRDEERGARKGKDKEIVRR